MVRIHKSHRIFLRIALATILLLLVATPVLSAELLQNALDSMQQSELWWDQLWEDTFDHANDISSNISSYTFVTAVRSIIGISLIFFFFQYGRQLVEVSGTGHAAAVVAEFMLPVVLVALFLGNQGEYSRLLAYGMRHTIDSWSDGVMSLNIAGHNIRAALSDQLVTQDAKSSIASQAQHCLAMPHTAVALPSITRPPLDPAHPLTKQQKDAYSYLECIQSLGDFARETQTQAADSHPCAVLAGGACEFAQKWLSNAIDTIDTIFQNEQKSFTTDTNVPGVGEIPKKGWSDLLADAAISNGYGPILNATQSMWTSLLELALWLSALFAPMFIAFSIIPGRQNMFIAWVIEFLTIGLAKLAYVIVIGVVAVQLSDREIAPGTDLQFPLALGLFAPGVSFAVVSVGGVAAAMSFQRQAVVSVTVVSGLVSGFGASFSRYLDKNR